jgi:apolipoprotein N-acyltransferase
MDGIQFLNVAFQSNALYRYGIAFCAGAIGAVSMAPFDVLPAMMVTLSTCIVLLDHAGSIRVAAISGWWLGFGYFVAGLWWLGTAFFVDETFIWAAPFGIFGLPALLALFFAAGFAMAFYLWRSGPSRLLLFAVCIGFSEWLRGTILTGFPWNSLGMALGDHLAFAQIVSGIGLNGLTFTVALLFASPVLLFEMKRYPANYALVSGSFAILALLYGFGEWRLAQMETSFVPNIQLRLMQPDMPLDDRFSRQHAAEIMHHYFDLSTKGSYPSSNGMKGISHLIWPETSFPFLLDSEPAARAEIAHILKEGTVLLAGAVRAEGDGAIEERRYFNAIQAVNQDGFIVASADKTHLVPFGEYLPLNGLLTALGLRQFVQAPGGFTPAKKRQILRVPGLPSIAPLICYEAIFPSETLPDDTERPGLILNVTNDAWFGLTPGPSQHFAQARLRAIEQGLPLVRSANNGISAILDGVGREIALLPLGTSGVIDGPLPTALAPTLFARLPHFPWAGALYLIGIVGLILTKRQLMITRIIRIFTTSNR